MNTERDLFSRSGWSCGCQQNFAHIDLDVPGRADISLICTRYLYDLYDLCDLCNLYDVQIMLPGWKAYNLHDLAHSSWPGICTTQILHIS